MRAECSVECAVLQTTQTRSRIDGSGRFVVIGAVDHRTTLVVFTCFYLADAAAFILGQYRGVFESGYRKVEWAVLIHRLLKSNPVAAVPFQIHSASIFRLLCSLDFLAIRDEVW